MNCAGTIHSVHILSGLGGLVCYRGQHLRLYLLLSPPSSTLHAAVGAVEFDEVLITP